MKDGNLLALLVILFGLFIVNSVHRATNYKYQMKEIQELKILIEQRNHLDSMYWEHIENCAFIHKDNIGVGYQSYLYDKHHRKYIK